MAKVIKFEKKTTPDPVSIKLVNISAEIDALILKYLSDPDINDFELAGLLAHRLGTLISHIEKKSELWDVCEQVVRKQAKID